MDGHGSLVTAAADYPPVFSYVPAPTENQPGAADAVISGVHVGLPAPIHQGTRQQLLGHGVGLPVIGTQQIISRPSKLLVPAAIRMPQLEPR